MRVIAHAEPLGRWPANTAFRHPARGRVLLTSSASSIPLRRETLPLLRSVVRLVAGWLPRRVIRAYAAIRRTQCAHAARLLFSLPAVCSFARARVSACLLAAG